MNVSNDVLTVIPGFPNYSITKDGRIYSKQRQGCSGSFLKPRLGNHGYLRVTLRGMNKSIDFLVQRLVLITYMGLCPVGMEACHNNGVRIDNRLENLRWDTRKANHADAIKHGTHPGLLPTKGLTGEKNGQSKLTKKQITIIKYLRKIAKFSTGDIAWQFDVSYKTIWKICTGRSWRHLNAAV